MKIYICPLGCGYQTTDKSNLNRHLRKKKLCNNKSQTNTHNFVCILCNKVFSRKDNLNRHIKKSCIENKKNIEIEKLKEENEKLKTWLKINRVRVSLGLGLQKNISQGIIYNNPYSTHKKVNRELRNNNASTNTKVLSNVGCTVSFLYYYIEKQFLTGMSWHNHGCWHLDHRKPVSAFDLNNNIERMKCSHYTNYQPLWAHENLKKGHRFNESEFNYEWTENGWTQKKQPSDGILNYK
jgi:hypothetical protein